jgi:hypothetical protein
MTNANIRQYLKHELLVILEKAVTGKALFTIDEIREELDRRDNLQRLAEDTVRYPELSTGFR